MDNTGSEDAGFDDAAAKVQALRERINAHLLGQEDVVDQVLVALFANGHVLIEGVPGLGKTLLVRVLANCFQGEFKRIQFTPDLMPADITGHVFFDSNSNEFRMRKGPVFTNLLLADEINRSPAKTQAALLEIMQERQVTLEGEAHELPGPFMVLATQNPIEQEGTYALPEAELDRFLMKVFIDYPQYEDESKIADLVSTGSINDQVPLAASGSLVSAQDILDIQQLVSTIVVDAQVLDYAVRLVRATRSTASLARGAGIRATIALMRCARALAMLKGEKFVLPDDVKQLAIPIMRHRIALATDLEIEGISADQALTDIIETVEAPRL